MHRSIAVFICLIIPTLAVAAPIPRKTYLREVSAIIREVDHKQAAYASLHHENAQASSIYVLRMELDLPRGLRSLDLRTPRRRAARVALQTRPVSHQREVQAFAAHLAFVAFGLGLGAAFGL